MVPISGSGPESQVARLQCHSKQCNHAESKAWQASFTHLSRAHVQQFLVGAKELRIGAKEQDGVDI
eukprot:3061898-Amphidinium_carterae.1